MTSYLERLAAEERLSDAEWNVLRQVDVRSDEDTDSLLSAFPSIGEVGVRVDVLSNAMASSIGGAYANFAAATAQQPPDVAFGAEPPPFVSTPLGTAVGVGVPSISTAPPSPKVDLRLPRWPVKDQGQRGTCVAFSVTACVEHH